MSIATNPGGSNPCGVGSSRRRARAALLGDRREAVVGGNDDIGHAGNSELRECLLNAPEIVVGVLDRRQRCRSVDAGRQPVQAVALVVLRAIGITRPEDENKGPVACLEHRQHNPGRDVCEVVLLCSVGDRGSGRRGIAGLAVVPTARRG